jgi:selenocysteine lyase/cysteine desulfurase
VNWDEVAALFPLDPKLTFFDVFSLSSHPRPVREAIERFRDLLDAGPESFVMEHGPALDAAVTAAASSYMDVAADEIALTDSTTMGLGVIYGGIDLGPGGEILTTTHDYYASDEALRLREQDKTMRAVTVRRVPLYDDPARADPQAMVDTLRAAVSGRTRMIALTWVHSGTGVKLPIAEMCAAVAELNLSRGDDSRILVSVDGTHGFAADPATISSLRCDLFASACHKWLFGPRGTGVAWGTSAAWSRVTPRIPTFDRPTRRARVNGLVHVTPPGALLTPGGYHTFEHRWALPAAFDLHLRIGRERIGARIAQLALALKEGLAKMPHIRLHTPMDERVCAGIVCLDVDGLPAVAAVERLREAGIVAGATPYLRQHVRLGPTIANSEKDIEKALDVLYQFR